MKSRAVTITIEVETNAPLKHFKNGNVRVVIRNLEQWDTLEVRKVQASVKRSVEEAK